MPKRQKESRRKQQQRTSWWSFCLVRRIQNEIGQVDGYRGSNGERIPASMLKWSDGFLLGAFYQHTAAVFLHFGV